MTNEEGEYLNYKIKTKGITGGRKDYDDLSPIFYNPNGQYADPNNNQSHAYVPHTQGGNTSYHYTDIEPTTVDNDLDLQAALSQHDTIDYQDDRDLALDAKVWDGMESGAIEADSTQSSDWLSTVPIPYRRKALEWSKGQGILEIIPRQQRQKFTYATIAYISQNTSEPKTQRIPISDVSVVPHQINFDFYDTTEGRIGVSHAVEKHMSVEFDVYVTDYIYYNWNAGKDGRNKYYMHVPEKIKKMFWNAIKSKNYAYNNLMVDAEQTDAFAHFRNSFLQQHLGWVCDFNSLAFGRFTGVINDVSFQINSGESFAKWHVKIEEAIFTGDYSKEGQKPEAESTTTENASTTNSGTADEIEDIQTG